ncbi:MAG TPA: ABC transporter ATP-binding protein [Candidatus Flavonifractor intestinipullorum]|uniref:ABC transporter ATP-binding protein n=1 Tax=Candidatus Flavonifractor intestinipullorum TaxID=2838587 RepID=A0A9D2MAD0_9FIRM|nr:ABC transporter ATP-binding protein [Candidatus Flavonifractor intestinipullorum]
MSDTLLKVSGLKTYFFTASGVSKAVDGVSFELKRGEVMGIVGESGSGKSVTSNSIIRLLPPQTGRIVDGEITFEGRDILAMSHKQLLEFRGKEIATIFQDPMTSLDPVFKIGKQMVEMICAHQDVSKKEAWDMAVHALARVGIPEPEKRMEAYPYELSGGMCQRVIIAMAVCCKPKFIIADEPTTALDVTVQAQVLDLLKDLQKDMDTSILLITHNLGVVWEMCDKVMVMYAGNTVESADTKELYSNPLHPYTWGLLDSIPRLSDHAKEDLRTIPGTPPDLRLTGKCCNFYNRCPYMTKQCCESVPPLVEVEPGHFVACHRQNGVERLVRGEVTHDAE